MKRNPILYLIVLLCSYVNLNAQVDFQFNSNFKILKGSKAINLPSTWVNQSYTTTQDWINVLSPIRYGDGKNGFLLDDMQNNYSSVYMRSSFQATNAANIHKLSFHLDYDDGFILWLNGEVVISRNAPETPSHAAFAPENHESGDAEIINILSSALTLNEGENIIAVQGFNVSLESSDFYFDLKIEGEPEAPILNDSSKLTFSHTAGFYDTPFQLTLNAPDTAYNITYTLDGSNPQNSSSAITQSSPIHILVDPSRTDGRAQTPAFTVRASLSKLGYSPSIPQNQTYIFVDEVITQKHPGGDFPNQNINGQLLDWEMDAKVSQDPTYGPQMQRALQDIPSLCISTDIDNLFGPSNGIYVNAEGRGMEWERFSSVELIHPDGKAGFSINAGLRIRGGWSRHDDFPKHSFRLFFRSGYGESKLRYPLFDEEGVDEFDKIDLRTAQNYSWSKGMTHNTFSREVFARDSQRDMNQPYTRSRYYHLYLNGMYWGLYQTQERSEARFAASYLGGDKDDYDVLKCDGTDYARSIEATDGVTDTWEEIYNRCKSGFSTNENYFDLIGRDAQGKPKKNSQILVDIDNLIDYMIAIFYTGNFDGPTSKFGGEQKANNFFAILKRDDKSKGFVFFCHDAEHSLMFEAHSPGIGLYENRVSIPSMNVADFSAFHPQWLHHKLTQNAEYRQRFADRVQKHLFGEGTFTPDVARKRFNTRVKQIQWAIIAESARWGDAKDKSLKTKDNDWLPEITSIQTKFFPQRTNIVIDQLKDAQLYPTIEAPDLKDGNKNITAVHVRLSEINALSISNPNDKGDIYLCDDGSDPRLVGGAINDKAQKLPSNTVLNYTTTSILKVRIKYHNIWSALKEYHLFADTEDYSNLKITELHYNPLDSVIDDDTIPGKSFEFLEIKNTGTHAINVSKLEIDSMIRYQFPEYSILPAASYYVIATKPKWFYARYGMVPTGNCEQFMDNKGEEFILKDSANNYLIHFFYSDDAPWPERADGEGASLTASVSSPLMNPNNYLYWRASSIIGGTPFSDDLSIVNSQSNISFSEQAVRIYPNPCKGQFNIQFKDGHIWANRMELWSLSGKQIHSEAISSDMSFDLEEMKASPGILLLHLYGDANKRQEVVKLIYQP